MKVIFYVYFLQSHLPSLCLSVNALRTPVVISTDEWEHLQSISTPPPFNSGAPGM